MTVTERLHRVFGRFVSGTSIWAFDWDICAVLDGCRADTFQEVRDCDTYQSVAASSKQWLRRTFTDPPDSVAYITANPFLDVIDAEKLAYVHQEGVRDVNGVETVPPSVLADHAAALWNQREEYGVDRVVVHFMQPHVPFRSRPEWFDPFFGTETWGSGRWNSLANGDIGREEWFDAYRDNLSWGLFKGVYRLAEFTDATIGVTADHGNAAGEWGIYGHPNGVAVPSVRMVPWYIVDGNQIRDVPDVELGGQELTTDAAEKQLRALGYR